MLGRRLISAAIIISMMLLFLGCDFWLGRPESLARPGLLLCGLAMLTAALAAGELAALFENAASPVAGRELMLSAVAMVGITSAPVLWTDYPADCPLGRFGFAMAGLVVGFVIPVAMEMARYDGAAGASRGEVMDRLGRAALTLVYLNTMFAFLIPHRYLEGSNALGLLAIITLITTVKMSDAAAYFAGKALGTIKLAPRLSPGKTVQGSVGGLVGGCMGALIVVYLVAPLVFGVTIDKPWWWVLVYGVLVTLAGMFGDLAESMFKRDSNTKDSSRWLPGLGGVLDVIDSLVFASPVSFLLWI